MSRELKKIAFVGPQKAGKTVLIKQLIGEKIEIDQYAPTFNPKILNSGSDAKEIAGYRPGLWEMPGKKEQKPIDLRTTIMNADICVICVPLETYPDPNAPNQSFYTTVIKYQKPIRQINKTAKILVVGTKSDLAKKKEREILSTNIKKIKELLSEENYIEYSAQDSNNIQKVKNKIKEIFNEGTAEYNLSQQSSPFPSPKFIPSSLALPGFFVAAGAIAAIVGIAITILILTYNPLTFWFTGLPLTIATISALGVGVAMFSTGALTAGLAAIMAVFRYKTYRSLRQAPTYNSTIPRPSPSQPKPPTTKNKKTLQIELEQRIKKSAKQKSQQPGSSND